MFFAHSCLAVEDKEIASLLQFIEKSDCVFIRNGKGYDPGRARQHILKKYSYHKDRITSAEDFIRYAASGSSITGEPYRVDCNGVEMNTSGWLKAELDRLRKK